MSGFWQAGFRNTYVCMYIQLFENGTQVIRNTVDWNIIIV